MTELPSGTVTSCSPTSKARRGCSASSGGLKAVATIELGTRPAGIAVGFGKVWVTAY